MKTPKEHLILATCLTVMIAMLSFIYQKIRISKTLERKTEALAEFKKGSKAVKLAPAEELAQVNNEIETMKKSFTSIDKMVKTATEGFIPLKDNTRRTQLELKISQIADKAGLTLVTNKTIMLNNKRSRKKEEVSVNDYHLPVRQYVFGSNFFALHSFLTELTKVKERVAILDLKVVQNVEDVTKPLTTQLTMAY